MIQGKLELTIKINELPKAKTTENGWQQFELDCDGRIISVTVKPNLRLMFHPGVNVTPKASHGAQLTKWLSDIGNPISQLN